MLERREERIRERVDGYILESRNHVEKAWYAADRALRLAKKENYVIAQDIDACMQDIKKIEDKLRDVLWG